MSFLNEREEWKKAFDDLLRFGSEGLLAPEIIDAKKIFFSKIGNSHEMKEEVFEIASQTFLEWYLFDYPTKTFGKTPAVIWCTLQKEESELRRWIQNSLDNRWSIFEIKELKDNEMTVQDWIVGIPRTVWLDRDRVEAKVWSLSNGQMIQARLFPLKTENRLWLSHLWIHPDSERPVLEKISAKLRLSWRIPHLFLIDAFESVVRSLEVTRQVRQSGRKNWYYQELLKRYA